MSSLVFYTDEEQAVVATDTLAVHPDGAPFMLTSKALFLPHLKTIIAGTGVGTFSVDWACAVNNNLVVRSIEHLNYHTPNALRERWQELVQKYPEVEDAMTTVYHFGVSGESGEIVAYAYRSTDSFESEVIPYGFRYKPECAMPEGESVMELIPKIMEAQRQHQESVPANERLYIGGEVTVTHLSKNGCATSTLYTFEDYEDQLEEIFENFERRGG